jgi:hypothetical protein
MGSSPIYLEKRLQGFKDFYSKDFIRAFNILSISAISFLIYPVIGGLRSKATGQKARS